ncbi:MAG: LysR family transcriptional regulator [Herpetosiphonaceae bacterium]|nr:LysR family transcriptional regulator [Herpetosiphonaceae bacterium]
MLLDLAKLRVFVAVARAGSFTRAAEVLDLRQPTVSQQVGVLERELRVQLFERLGRGVVLTAAGATLLPYAEQMLSLAAEAEVATREAGGVAARTLRLGVGNTLATYVLPDLLARLRWERPEALVQITVGNTEQLLAAAGDGRVELVLVGSPAHDPRLVMVPFLRDEVVAIVPPDDPLAHYATITLAELSDHTLLVREAGSAQQSTLSALLRDRHIQPQRTLTLGNIEAIKRSVEAGLGAAVVPEITVRREVQAGTLVSLHIADVREERSFNYAFRHDRALSSTAQAFIAILEKPFE